MDIRPIKTDADYEWAVAEIASYFENEPEPGSPEGDRFDVLAVLIQSYEDEHYPIIAPDPVEAIQAHMKLFGINQGRLAEILGSASRASEILNRKRSLTLDMIVKLNREWRIPTDILVQPYHLTERQTHRRA